MVLPDSRYQKAIVATVALWLFLSSSGAAAELYRYTNEDGVPVLDSHVPARYVKNGYTILSLDGRVLEVVPRALTQDEIEERDRRLAEQRELEEELRKQEVYDQNLLRLYSTPSDVIRARDTKLASIEGFINTQQGNVRRLESQKRQLESRLANIERAGGTISPDTLNRIATIESRIEILQGDIISKEQEMEILSATFAADLARLKELQKRPRTES